MISCPECGVILAPDATVCPLCGTRAVNAAPPRPQRPYVEVERLRPVVLPPRPVVLRLITLLALTAVVVVILVDLSTGARTLGWSTIAVTAIGVGYVALVAPMLVRPRVAAVPIILGAVAVLLLVIDLSDGRGINWFAGVGLPVLAGLLVSIAGFGILAGRLHGFHTPAGALIAATLLCVWIDVVITNAFFGAPRLSWSFVVLVAAVPTALFLVALEHTVARYIDMRRRLHL